MKLVAHARARVRGPRSIGTRAFGPSRLSRRRPTGTLGGGQSLVFTRGGGKHCMIDSRAAAPETRDRGRAARVPVELSGLGGRGDGSSARGHRGGAGACGPEQGRGGLSAHGPVRVPASAMDHWAAYLAGGTGRPWVVATAQPPFSPALFLSTTLSSSCLLPRLAVCRNS